MLEKREPCRYADLPTALRLPASLSWMDNGMPGLENYYLETIPQFVQIILSALEDKGYKYSMSSVREVDIEVEDFVFTIELPDIFYTVPQRSYKDNPYHRSGIYYTVKHCLPYIKLPIAEDNETAQAREVLDYMCKVAMPEYWEKHPPNVADIDKFGSHAMLLFWSDDGTMLTQDEAEEWWCEHSLEEIRELYGDLLDNI